MKKTSSMLLLLMAASVWAGPGDRDHNPLNLTAEQQEQMKVVKQAAHEKLQAARAEIHAETKTQMATFLTEEQLAQMESLSSHRKEHAQMRQHHKKMKRKRTKEERGH